MPTYHRRSARMPHFDYTERGAYYVTIVTHERLPLFGEIIGEEMRLSRVGEIVIHEWRRTAELRDDIELDDYVVMPNHLHAVLFLTESERPGVLRHAPTKHLEGSPLRRDPHSLGAVIGAFKSAATRAVRLALGEPSVLVWQRGYYDHIIRSEADLLRIRQYIVDNPLQWAIDEHNPLR